MVSEKKFTIWQKIYLSLRRIYSILIGTATDWTRSKAAMFFTFIFPILMILLQGYIFGSAGDTEFPIYYVNEDIYEVGGKIHSFHPADQFLEELGLNNQTKAKELGVTLN
ncbi:MAG: hypothetical protein U9O98_08210 [Asgard group archaeon]|nr:hypothetical protein [Asgard group archaeon]